MTNVLNDQALTLSNSNSIIVDNPSESMPMTAGKSHSQQRDFNTITFNDLVGACQSPVDLTAYQPNEQGKLADAKAHCPWFLPSDAPTKLKADVERHNAYNALVVDIDEGDLPISEVDSALSALIGGESIRLIYSTMSSKADDKRWRVVVPFSQTIDVDHWKAVQSVAAWLMSGDDCTVRSQQISYMPAVSCYNADSFEFHHGGAALLNPLDSVFNDHVQQALNAIDAELEEEETRNKKPQAATPKVNLPSGAVSPIDAFNKQNDWDSLLSSYGYKKRGKKWIAPSSTSGAAGVIISYRDSTDGRYVSAHGSDPLNDGYSHDKFSVFCEMTHGGNVDAALKDAGDRIRDVNGVSITEHNQQLYATSQANNAPCVAAANDYVDTGSIEQVWNEPEPLNKTPLAPVLPLTDDMLPESVRGYVVDYAERLDNSPVDFAAVSVVISAGALIGGNAEIQPKRFDDSWRLVPTMWGGAVGQPSTRKTPSLACGRKLIDFAQSEVINQQNAEAMEVYELEQEAMAAKIAETNEQAKQAIIDGDRDKAMQLKREVRDVEPAKPEIRKVVINDATSEAVAMRLQDNPAGVLMFRDELTSWLVSMERADRQHERGFYLEGFNGFGSYSQERVTRKNIELDRVILSVMGGIQPAKLAPLLAAKAAGNGDDGLLERVTQLMVFPDFNKKEYTDRKADKKAEERARKAFCGLAKLGDRDKPLVCRFDDEAQDIFDDWARHMLEREEKAPEALQGILGKYTALGAKLAMVFHLMNETGNPDASAKQEPSAYIGKAELNAAIKWMEYLESHVMRIMGFLDREEGVASARILLEKLPQLSPFFTRNTLGQKDWKGLKTKDAREEALAKLCECGYLQAYEIQNNGTRPTVQFWVHPDYRT